MSWVHILVLAADLSSLVPVGSLFQKCKKCQESGPISAQATEFNFMANKVCQTTIAAQKESVAIKTICLQNKINRTLHRGFSQRRLCFCLTSNRIRRVRKELKLSFKIRLQQYFEINYCPAGGRLIHCKMQKWISGYSHEARRSQPAVKILCKSTDAVASTDSFCHKLISL